MFHELLNKISKQGAKLILSVPLNMCLTLLSEFYYYYHYFFQMHVLQAEHKAMTEAHAAAQLDLHADLRAAAATIALLRAQLAAALEHHASAPSNPPAAAAASSDDLVATCVEEFDAPRSAVASPAAAAAAETRAWQATIAGLEAAARVRQGEIDDLQVLRHAPL